MKVPSPQPEDSALLVTDLAIDAATETIRGNVLHTPMFRSPGLSDLLSTEIHLKCELFQPTGSFKVRGVFNKLSTLSVREKQDGVIAFSAGNHAMAVAYAARQAGIEVTICMPATAVAFKIEAVRDLGAHLELVEGDLVARAMAIREERGLTLIHPFDDPAVVAGAATCGREIIMDLPNVSTVLVPIGGGGLISGVAVGIRRANPDCRIIGIEPSSADVVTRSLLAGHPTAFFGSKSIADGLTAPITGAVNLAHIRTFVDEIVTVDEEDIAAAFGLVVRQGKLAVEPAAGVTVAAVLSGAVSLQPNEPSCLIMCGGNTDRLA
jgi:threonine dehydratase